MYTVYTVYGIKIIPLSKVNHPNCSSSQVEHGGRNLLHRSGSLRCRIHRCRARTNEACAGPWEFVWTVALPLAGWVTGAHPTGMNRWLPGSRKVSEWEKTWENMKKSLLSSHWVGSPEHLRELCGSSFSIVWPTQWPLITFHVTFGQIPGSLSGIPLAGYVAPRCTRSPSTRGCPAVARQGPSAKNTRKTWKNSMSYPGNST